MKKTLLFIGLFFAFAMGSFAQKYALVDMEYILERIPEAVEVGMLEISYKNN